MVSPVDTQSKQSPFLLGGTPSSSEEIVDYLNRVSAGKGPVSELESQYDLQSLEKSQQIIEVLEERRADNESVMRIALDGVSSSAEIIVGATYDSYPVSVYFDTPDLDLINSGLATARFRYGGDQRHHPMVGVKIYPDAVLGQENHYDDGISRRVECEWITDPREFSSTIDCLFPVDKFSFSKDRAANVTIQKFLRDRIDQVIGNKPLVPHFATHSARTHYDVSVLLKDKQKKVTEVFIEVAVDVCTYYKMAKDALVFDHSQDKKKQIASDPDDTQNGRVLGDVLAVCPQCEFENDRKKQVVPVTMSQLAKAERLVRDLICGKTGSQTFRPKRDKAHVGYELISTQRASFGALSLSA